MTAQLDFGALEAWVRRRRNMPTSCARPLSALIAHCGLRLNETDAEKEVSKSTIRFLDKAVPKRDPAEFDDLVDEAQLRLLKLQEKLGGIWPIEAAIGDEDSGERPPSREFTTLMVERGLGKQGDRGITDANLLLLLGVLIVATETPSQAAAIEIVLDVFGPLGLPPRGSSGAAVTVSRTKPLVVHLIEEQVPAELYGPTDLTPMGVRAAYERVAIKWSDASTTVPTLPPDLR